MNKLMIVMTLVVGSIAVSGCTRSAFRDLGARWPTARSAESLTQEVVPEIGSSWQLTGSEPGGTMDIFATTISGKDGCNFYQATWTARAQHRVRFSNFSGTTAACPGRLSQPLINARSWGVVGDELLLRGADDELLATFRQIRQGHASGGSR